MFNKRSKTSRFNYIYNIIMIILTVGILSSLFLNGTFNYIETNLYDVRAKLSSDKSFLKTKYKKADKNIVILAIDDYTIQELSKYEQLDLGRLPWTRRTYADIVNFANKGKPKAIVMDLVFGGSEGPYPVNHKSDEYFAKTIKSSNNVTLAMVLKTPRRFVIDNSNKIVNKFVKNKSILSYNQVDKLLFKKNRFENWIISSRC